MHFYGNPHLKHWIPGTYKRAGTFYSIVKGATSADSDIDILVELGYKICLLELVGIKYELVHLLGRK